MFHWYVINTYSGHEDKVARNLEHRKKSLGEKIEAGVREVVVPKEEIVETRDGQKVAKQKTIYPGYVFVRMVNDDEVVYAVRNTPGVTGFAGAQYRPDGKLELVPLTEAERKRFLEHKEDQTPEAAPRKAQAEFTLGQVVKVTSGPLSDFDGEIIEINPEAGKLKVHVSIFERQVPVELNFTDVRKVD